MKDYTRQLLTTERFREWTRPIVGLPVSHTWRGYGSAIFLELGDLVEEKCRRKNGTVVTKLRGEFCLMLEGSWRVEKPRSVFFGSWSKDRILTNRLSKLQGSTVTDVFVEGRLPELVLQLSSGYWVHSFTTVEGQPEWCLFDGWKRRSRWIDSSRGQIRLTTEHDIEPDNRT